MTNYSFDWNNQLLAECSVGDFAAVLRCLEAGASVNVMDERGRSALRTAAASGHTAVVELLLDRGAAAKIVDEVGDTALIVAAKAGHISTLRALLTRRGGGTIDYRGQGGATALLSATRSGSRDVVKFLLDRSANANIGDESGRTPLHVACTTDSAELVALLLEHGADLSAIDSDNGNSPLHFAAEHGKEEIARLLLDKGAAVDARNAASRTPLYVAATEGHAAIARLVVERGADVDIPSNKAWTPLCIASLLGHTEIVHLLLSRGAKVNEINCDGATALICACSNGHLEIASALIEHGADLNVVDENGYSALAWGLVNTHSEIVQLLEAHGAKTVALMVESTDSNSTAGDTDLHTASLEGDAKKVTALLEGGADVNCVNDHNRTPLFMAAWYNHVDVARALFRFNPSLSIADIEGNTALRKAIAGGQADVVELLLEREGDTSVLNNGGRSLLHLAVSCGHADVVSMLIGRGVKIEVEDEEGDGALHIAAKLGESEIVTVLLDAGTDVDIANKVGSSALYIAAHYGREGVVVRLLDRGASVDFARPDGKTALYVASECGHEDIVSRLLDHGASVDLATAGRSTPLHAAVDCRHESIAELLLRRGADPDAQDLDEQTALYKASLWGIERVVQQLLERGADVDIPSYKAWTPLCIASLLGHTEIVHLLLSRGAKVNEINCDGATALICACSNGHLEIASALIEHGADLNVVDENGYSALAWGLVNTHSEIVQLLVSQDDRLDRSVYGGGNQDLHMASWNGSVGLVELLLEGGADVNCVNDHNRTPLFMAAWYNHVDVARALFRFNPSLSITDTDGNTALHKAGWENQQDMVVFLIDHGADARASGQGGNTLLHMASWNGNVGLVELLLEGGADVNCVNDHNRTPLFMAAWYNHVDVARALFRFNPSLSIADIEGNTALHKAGWQRQQDMVVLLIESGADMSAHGQGGNTLLHIATWNGETTLANSLLVDGVAADSLNDSGLTACHIVSKNGRCDLLAILLDRGADVDTRSPAGETSLFLAAKNGHLDAVKLLLDRGADVDAADNDGDTPLLVSSRCGFMDIVEILLENDASTEVLNSRQEDALLAAASAGHFDIFAALKGAGMSGDVLGSNGETPLTHAIRWGQLQAVNLLLRDGWIAFSRVLGKTMESMSNASMFEFQEMWDTTLARLRTMLATCEGREESASTLSRPFATAVSRLFRLKLVCENSNVFTRLVSSRKLVLGFQDLHTELDHLARRLQASDSSVTNQPSSFEQYQLALVANFQRAAADDELISQSLASDADVTEAKLLLQYEKREHSDKYTKAERQLMDQFLERVLQLSDGIDDEVPTWFLPRHELVVSEEKALSSPTHRVYRGKWMSSSTIVCEYKGSRDRFVVDCSAWFPLNHPYVIRLLGACHLRDPSMAFFENVTSTNLLEYLREDDNKDKVWQKLYEVALGLNYLHERKIVLGKIQCSDVWVGTDGHARIATLGQEAAPKDAATDMSTVKWRSPEQMKDEAPTFASDVHSFGKLIIEAFTQKVPWAKHRWSNFQIKSAVMWGQLPPCPAGMNSAQWHLIERMSALDPSKRVSLAFVIEQLKVFAAHEHTPLGGSPDALTAGAVIDLCDFIVPELGLSIPAFLARLEIKSSKATDVAEVVAHVHARLVNVFECLEKMHALPNSIETTKFVDVLLNFDNFMRTAVSEASVVQRAKSRRVSLRDNLLHREIDGMLELLAMSHVDPIHSWTRDPTAFDSIASTSSMSSNTSLSTRSSHSATDKNSESSGGVVKFLHFEQKHRNHKFDAIDIDSVNESLYSMQRPSWFIPIHELKYRKDEFIGVGAFGAVYRGAWLGTPVVVKFMGYEGDDKDAEVEEMFFHELRVWHPLTHPHVIKLYGACHVGKRFFVCEFAANGTLRDYLKNDAGQSKLWKKMHEVALGLQYLHEQNIVHNDLKGDNFLVGADGKAKITDFGLSCISNAAEVKIDPKQQGAQQWKAPEYLRGERSTLASDIYSFGMCILEAATGRSPWGSVADVFVRAKLRKGSLPPRPKELDDDQWTLIEMMCASNPAQRLKISSVVEQLYEEHKTSGFGSASQLGAVHPEGEEAAP